MKGERILYANDTEIAREGIQAIMENYASKEGHEHQLVGMVSSLPELKKFLKRKVKPTVFFFDPRFPHLADGEKAAKVVRELSPETVIVSLSSYKDINFADHNLEQGIDVHELIEFFQIFSILQSSLL